MVHKLPHTDTEAHADECVSDSSGSSDKANIFLDLIEYELNGLGGANDLLIIIPHQKLLQSDWSFTYQHFRCLVLSTFESCHMIDIMLPRKPNICHVRDIMLPCKPNINHASFKKVILRRAVCSDTYNP